MLLLEKNNRNFLQNMKNMQNHLIEVCKIICETVTYMSHLWDAGDLRKKWFFFLKYPSTTRAFWRIKLNQWDFRTRVIMTNTSLTIGLQVPDRLNCVTHHLTHLNWNTEGADYMVTSVRQTSNQARLKQLLIKTNKLLIVKLSLGNTLYKNVMWASNLEHKNCTFLIL